MSTSFVQARYTWSFLCRTSASVMAAMSFFVRGSVTGTACEGRLLTGVDDQTAVMYISAFNYKNPSRDVEMHTTATRGACCCRVMSSTSPGLPGKRRIT